MTIEQVIFHKPLVVSEDDSVPGTVSMTELLDPEKVVADNIANVKIRILGSGTYNLQPEYFRRAVKERLELVVTVDGGGIVRQVSDSNPSIKERHMPGDVVMAPMVFPSQDGESPVLTQILFHKKGVSPQSTFVVGEALQVARTTRRKLIR